MKLKGAKTNLNPIPGENEMFQKRCIQVFWILLLVSLIIPAFEGRTMSAEETVNVRHRVKNLNVLILSTMLASPFSGIGEWGFAALVEADGNRILFDTGHWPDTVLRNAKILDIDLL